MKICEPTNPISETLNKQYNHLFQVKNDELAQLEKLARKIGNKYKKPHNTKPTEKQYKPYVESFLNDINKCYQMPWQQVILPLKGLTWQRFHQLFPDLDDLDIAICFAIMAHCNGFIERRDATYTGSYLTHYKVYEMTKANHPLRKFSWWTVKRRLQEENRIMNNFIFRRIKGYELGLSACQGKYPNRGYKYFPNMEMISKKLRELIHRDRQERNIRKAKLYANLKKFGTTETISSKDIYSYNKNNIFLGISKKEKQPNISANKNPVPYRSKMPANAVILPETRSLSELTKTIIGRHGPP